MYIVGKTVIVNWILHTTNSPAVLADFHVSVGVQDGMTEVLSGAIEPSDFIPATATTDGGVSYKLTPNKQGLWTVGLITLVGGVPSTQTDQLLEVYINDTLICQQVRIQPCP